MAWAFLAMVIAAIGTRLALKNDTQTIQVIISSNLCSCNKSRVVSLFN